MESHPLVSVIIPNFNYARYLKEAILSVQAQTYSNTEIIVVNNGSTDDSLELLKQFGSKINLIDQENLGQSGARNSGLKAAKGDLIAFLDADDYWERDKLEKQIPLITSQTQLVYSGISRFRDETRKVESILNPQFKGDCRQYFTDLSAVSIILSGESTSLFTRKLLNLVGIFDPELNSASGWDFFRRCSILTQFDFVPEPLTNYRLHSSNMSNLSSNNIRDIRKAYRNLFSDNLWIMTDLQKKQIIKRLETSFVKTYLREGRFDLALKTIFSKANRGDYERKES
jgi:glycosyltransferase involved in cell wall biosynthesis